MVWAIVEETEGRKRDLENFILVYKRKEDKYRQARQRLETELMEINNQELILSLSQTKKFCDLPKGVITCGARTCNKCDYQVKNNTSTSTKTEEETE